MPELDVICIDSLEQLRQHAASWDDLWWRSEVTSPIARAELLAQWVEHFSSGQPFRAWVVAKGEQFLAALPLVQVCRGRVLATGDLASSPMSPGGDLLLDLESDTKAILSKLVNGMNHSPWPLLWLDSVALDRPRWQLMHEALNEAGIFVTREFHYHVGELVIENDWPWQQANWSGNLRRNFGKMLRRVERQGSLKLVMHSDIAVDQVDTLLRRGFEIENRSWKSHEGTTVLRSPEMYSYLLQQARQLAAWGQITISFLELNDRPIAFEYAWNAKGVYHSFKVSYDEEFANFSPGHLLLYYLIKHFYDAGNVKRVDCLGPLSDAISRWHPNYRPTGRLIAAAPGSVIGRVTHALYRRVVPALRCARGKPSRTASDAVATSGVPTEAALEVTSCG